MITRARSVVPFGYAVLIPSFFYAVAYSIFLFLSPSCAGHLKQLAKILDDPEASDNDRFVALELLKNANVASGMVLPGCQDTGTVSVSRFYLISRGHYCPHVGLALRSVVLPIHLRLICL